MPINGYGLSGNMLSRFGTQKINCLGNIVSFNKYPERILL
tara:strand:+ start:1253 stop:1372 length:120 start_codon:yes stop_codon:yes gene_type:complete